MGYEYTAIPAPQRGEKGKDAKTPTDRFALALSASLNRMAAAGWEYLRADVLPSEERTGLTGRSTVYHNLLIFRREAMSPKQADIPTETPVLAEPPAAITPAPPRPDIPRQEAARPEEPLPEAPKPDTPQNDSRPGLVQRLRQQEPPQRD
ncbi:DUF4177 domain-containing protein [Paracoccus sp. (in: a-proteobacteria)]|uniref:DUF4177 domain-containing protein n=1 Tax=Paracoccus sp. TaxID=267 RepID=UPI003A84078D